MNTIKLNTIGTDVPLTQGGGSSGGGVTIKNQSKSVEFTENGITDVRYDSGYTGLEKVSINVAIPNEEKVVDITENGTTEVVAENGFLNKVIVNTNVASSGGGGGDTPTPAPRPSWTGHADAEGLKAIGCTDEDIAYYQENGVNWNEDDDEYHKVTDDNKALYGVLTANNISSYKDRIVYLPKIDTSAKTNMSYMFSNCYSLVGIPQLDTSNVTNMSYMFSCYSLVGIPQLDTSNVTNMKQMFGYCYSLVGIPQLDTSNVTNMSYMFTKCSHLVSIPQLDTSNVTNMTQMFNSCYSLTHINLKNVKLAYDLSNANLLSKESLLYIINNEAATSATNITLASYAYTRLAEDADVVAALANHPNISISK